MLVSIILASYNRYPFILYSLYALENQNFDLSKMEVILVDDASSDQTPFLKYYDPPYAFKYIRNKKNAGLAATRNRGLENAKGRVIIFLDAEMLVDPNYVRNNYRHHLKNKNSVVIGDKVRRLYTFICPGFNERQIKEVNSLLIKRAIVKKRLSTMVDKNTKLEDISPIVNHLKHPLQILDKRDIQHFSSLRAFSTPKKDLTRILSQLGPDFEKSPIAWMACFGNLSLRKSLVKKVGGFDADFKKWGEEDRDFAYRLYKEGALFIVDKDLKRYHQEHLESSNKKKEGKTNKLLLQKKHPELNVSIRALKYIQKLDYDFLNKIVQEDHTLFSDFPGQFEEFKRAIVLMLQQIYILKSENKKVKNVLKHSGIQNNPLKREQIFKERDQVESLGKYPNLIKLFDILTNK
ncbi:glycosyltransferase family 2 protein [Cytobacillus dafuensis]|uniref:Glycosyltransferase family 2 protein n=1 Tax=Cytobacillus dafuensis TaxID=1742359 RepID=A0A5B8Z0E5_CYTDA|nr:glycosyltransferase family 2 protein [Cytobacillus dafuensis]QED46221.1 glycosyltransferase family 2 protein [Cytobacillus dafuensis]